MSKTQKTKGIASDIDIYVGKRLQLRRALLGLSQEKLGDAIGLTFQQIQKYEKGLNRISSGRLYEFSQILAVPIEYFFENYEDKKNYKNLINPSVHVIPNDLNTPEFTELARAYYSVPNSDIQKSIVVFIKRMASALNKSEQNKYKHKPHKD